MKFAILLATAILSLAIELERRKTTPQAQQQLASRPTQTYLQRFRQTILYRLLVRLFEAAALLATFGSAVLAFWGPFWPTEPKIELHETINASSFVLPFKITNRSVLFSQADIPISCNIDDLFLVDTAGNFGRFAGLRFDPPPISIGRADFINYQCSVSQYVRVRDDGSIEVGFQHNLEMRSTIAIFPKPPVTIAKVCLRVSGFYNVFGFRQHFSSNTFQWPAAPGQNQWMEGAVAPDLSGEFHCPH